MAQTLLEIVQEILDHIGGDEVNSITDTEESETIARIVKSTYRALLSHTSWHHTRRAVALTPRSDTSFPTHMKLNDDVKELISVRYNVNKVGETRRKYVELSFKEPDDFLRSINFRNNDQPNVDVVIDDSGIELLIFNDRAPTIYTTFNDVDIIFDAYDKSVDTTLQESKLQAQGYVIPEFLLNDTFVPDLPIDAFSLLLQDSLSTAQFRLRQIQDVKAEKEALKQSRWLSRKSWRTHGGIKYRDYGRH